MHTWTENQAGRGCEEMISSLLVFFDLEELCGAWSLIAWSDSCAGQSKNFYMIAFWQTLLALERFLKIEHKFPEVGYTFMDSDRDFAQIEKLWRKTERIFTVDEYHTLMRNAKRKNPFKATDVSLAMIRAKELAQKLKIVKRTRNVDEEKIKFAKIRAIRMTQFGFFNLSSSKRNTIVLSILPLATSAMSRAH